ncbi:MAG: hypothetical protein ACI8RZ_000815 [Myxococcota bacterium]
MFHWRPILRKLLSLLLILTLLPGWGELIESAEHLIHDGHLPHSTSHEETASIEEHAADTEHGCTPTSHHCECHQSVPVLPSSAPPQLSPRIEVVVLSWAPRRDTLISRVDIPPTPPPLA